MIANKMIQYLLLALVTSSLGDPLPPKIPSPSRETITESKPMQQRNSVQNERREADQIVYEYPTSSNTDTVKTCYKDDKLGECVQVYLCGDNDTIITDGSIKIKNKPVIDFRDLGECNNYLEKCCFLRKQEIPATEIPVGCGWANPEGVSIEIKHRHNGETNFAEFPWTVALQRKTLYALGPSGAPIYKYLGAGSLIHPKVVLTAAHYVVGEPASVFRVRAGEWDTNSNMEPYKYQDRTVAEVLAHPDFSNSNGRYDVSLLFLDVAVELAPNVGVACLAPAGIRAPAGATCIATGWGKKQQQNMKIAKILKRVEVPVVDHEQCQAQLRASPLGRHYELHGSFMCAGGGGVDTCRGDGGAPLVCPTTLTNRYIQYGIVSWGIGCHQYPGVYADVGYLRGWIDGEVHRRDFDPSVYTLSAQF